MKLEQQLLKATRNEQRVRVATLFAWATAILLPLGMLIVERGRRGMAPFPPMRIPLPFEMHVPPDFFGNVVGIVSIVSGVCAWVFLFQYFFKYRPALRNTRDEFQAALLVDLQRQVAEIKRQLPPPPS